MTSRNSSPQKSRSKIFFFFSYLTKKTHIDPIKENLQTVVGVSSKSFQQSFYVDYSTSEGFDLRRQGVIITYRLRKGLSIDYIILK